MRMLINGFQLSINCRHSLDKIPEHPFTIITKTNKLITVADATRRLFSFLTSLQHFKTKCNPMHQLRFVGSNISAQN